MHSLCLKVRPSAEEQRTYFHKYGVLPFPFYSIEVQSDEYSIKDDTETITIIIHKAAKQEKV